MDNADNLINNYEMKGNDMNLDYFVGLAWRGGANWLNEANDQWKTIIGARTAITSGSGGICYCYESSSPLPDLSYLAATPADCGLDPAIECYWYSNVMILGYELKPNDGVVLVESAQDLPGMLTNIPIYEANHQEARNHSETERVLNGLFDDDDDLAIPLFGSGTEFFQLDDRE